MISIEDAVAWAGVLVVRGTGPAVILGRAGRNHLGTQASKRIVSAEDEPGAEFVGGVDFEAVFARSVCHAGDFGNNGGMAIRGESLDDSGVKAGINNRVVDKCLARFELPGCG